MTSSSFVSVIVPAHRADTTLTRCLQALVTTDYARWECIVVDDASPGGGVASAATAFGFRTVRLDSRSGPAVGRNRAAAVARGDVLLFVDADVVIRPDTVRAAAEIFDGDASISAIFGSYDDSPDAPNFISQYKNLFHHYVHQNGSEFASTFWAGCGAVRRSAFETLGGFAEHFDRPSIEDIELGYRLRSIGGKIVLSKRLLVKHLKRWTLLSLLVTDIRDRGIPWTLLAMREPSGLVRDLNLRRRYRVCVALVHLAVLGAVATLATPWAAVIPVVCIGGEVTINRHFYRWFLRKRGRVFTLRVLPFHLLYHWYNGLSFLAGLTLHYSGRGMAAAQSRADLRTKTIERMSL